MSLIHSHNFPEERRLATVLFADIQGFTPLSERLDFEVVSILIQDVWMRLDKVIVDHGGVIDKHIGDAVMAIWGVPYGREDDAMMAVRAALNMQKSLNEYSSTSPREGAKDLKLRIGINTGLVFTTYIGLHKEYTVMGDTVNIASRLENHVVPGKIAITESTYNLVRGAYKTWRLGLVELKGKTQPVQTYVVEAEQAQIANYTDIQSEELKPNLTGREAEMDQMLDLFNHFSASGGRFLGLLTGEHGLGKSRLLGEYSRKLLSDQPNLKIITARGVERSVKSPFSFWYTLWRDRFGFSEDPNQFPVLEEFSDLVWLRGPFKTGLLDSTELAYKRVLEITQDAFSYICETGPLVMLVDDLQWVDRVSLDILAELLESSQKPLQLLVLAASRQDFLRKHVRWLNLATKTVSLNPLPMDDVFVKTAFPILENFPSDMLKDIAMYADGNPYYLGELVRGLLYSKETIDDDTTDLKTIPIPGDLTLALQTMLQARMDNLSREARDVLLLASVVGRVFWIGGIVAAARQVAGNLLHDMSEEVMKRVISNAIRELIRVDLVTQNDSSTFLDEQEFAFRHFLLQKAAYGLLSHKHRKIYNEAIVDWLSRQGSWHLKKMIEKQSEDMNLPSFTPQSNKGSKGIPNSGGVISGDVDNLFSVN